MDNTPQQTIKIEAGYGFDTATEIIMDLVMDGFSVEAEYKNLKWYISACKDSDTNFVIDGKDIEEAMNNSLQLRAR